MVTDQARHPVLGVSTLVRRDESVLLVRRGKAPLRDTWAFPGGLVEFGESLSEAAAREVMEETGVSVAIGGIIDHAEIVIRDEKGSPVRHYVLAVFEGAWLHGEPAAGDDAAEARWVDARHLREFQKTPDTERILRRLFGDSPSPDPAS
ncbi:MAG TPA: NUDIX hydrolase [Bauldia sp.]|nr:NUDIX hydrolase [Bauldia sp.]